MLISFLNDIFAAKVENIRTFAWHLIRDFLYKTHDTSKIERNGGSTDYSFQRR